MMKNKMFIILGILFVLSLTFILAHYKIKYFEQSSLSFGTPIASHMNGGVIRTSVGLNTYIDPNGLSPLEKLLMKKKRG